MKGHGDVKLRGLMPWHAAGWESELSTGGFLFCIAPSLVRACGKKPRSCTRRMGFSCFTRSLCLCAGARVQRACARRARRIDVPGAHDSVESTRPRLVRACEIARTCGELRRNGGVLGVSRCRGGGMGSEFAVRSERVRAVAIDGSRDGVMGPARMASCAGCVAGARIDAVRASQRDAWCQGATVPAPLRTEAAGGQSHAKTPAVRSP